MLIGQENRYQTLSSERGIRKDLKTGTFQVTKCIKGKRYFKNFDGLREARHWKNTYLPQEKMEEQKTKSLTLGEVWALYQEQVFPNLESSTISNRLVQARFVEGLKDVLMNDITPEVISKEIIRRKNESVRDSDGRRFSFDNELKFLKSIFNWYKVIDYKFVNPIIKQHKTLGRIKEKKRKEKKMNPKELLLFLNTLKEKPFWYDFALVQFAFASRVQETAGLQKTSIDFENKLVHIKDVVIWDQKTKHFDHLKSCPKNGEMRTCYMTPMIEGILKRRFKDDPQKCSYVFHNNGRPLSYREIQHHYDWALEKCGLAHKYSSTHFLRHTMATITRHVTGSLESVQSVTGHKDQRLVQHYAAISTDVQKDALIQVEKFLQIESSCGHLRSDPILSLEKKSA